MMETSSTSPSFQDNAYIQIRSDSPLTPSTTSPLHHDTDDIYRAVQVTSLGHSRKLSVIQSGGSLRDSKFKTILITTSQSLLRMDTAIARHHIQHGAEVLYMIPVYNMKRK